MNGYVSIIVLLIKIVQLDLKLSIGVMKKFSKISFASQIQDLTLSAVEQHFSPTSSVNVGATLNSIVLDSYYSPKAKKQVAVK